MKSDFEVHSVSTFEEIKLSRALARAIEANLHSVPIPNEILQAYLDLKTLYQKQIEEGYQ